jgi:hypothetical protein
MRFQWSDRRHWVLEIGRIEICRWGRMHVRFWRPAWARRYDSPPVNKVEE